MEVSPSSTDLPGDAEWCATSPLPLRLPEYTRPPRPERVAAGWERRFMADSARLAEFVELYTQLGFEVETEPVQPDEIGPDCEGCRLLMCRQFVTLYTRRRA
jgi:hypothetical protein